MKMGYEIDFLGVGEESKSGDAIAIRFGDLRGAREEQTVVVIDGGFSKTGSELVEHIRSHFGTEQVDLVINTHPDQDHLNGLETVLNELDVKELWIHQPWKHNVGLAAKFKDGRITDNSISELLANTLERAYALVALAESKDVLVREPFTGLTDPSGFVEVLGPTLDYYESLIPDFDGMPQKAALTTAMESVSNVFDAIKSAFRQVFASWGDDKITDDGVTSAKNNSSVITQLTLDERRFVFTGDSGIEALDQAADVIDYSHSHNVLRLIQIPHHGSRRNIGPKVLNRLLGPQVSTGETIDVVAIVSTAKNGEPKHPRKAVLNAFTHRGARVLVTKGAGVCHFNDAPGRHGWSPLSPEPYHYEYEEEEA
jgi:beta-lactamase superfamily II metal-dependent hydrolase